MVKQREPQLLTSYKFKKKMRADLPGGEDSERCSPTLEFRSW